MSPDAIFAATPSDLESNLLISNYYSTSPAVLDGAGRFIAPHWENQNNFSGLSILTIPQKVF
jgi:hypothetical protein